MDEYFTFEDVRVCASVRVYENERVCAFVHVHVHVRECQREWCAFVEGVMAYVYLYTCVFASHVMRLLLVFYFFISNGPRQTRASCSRGMEKIFKASRYELQFFLLSFSFSLEKFLFLYSFP